MATKREKGEIARKRRLIMLSPAMRYCVKSGRLKFGGAVIASAFFAVSGISAQEYNSVEDSIHQNPVVQQQRANVCQARSRFDQARAQQLPSMNFSVSGGQSIVKNVDEGPRRIGNDFARDRALNNTAIDGVFRVTQSLYDGQRAEMGKRIARNQGDAARLSVVAETETAAADILTVGLEYHLQNQLKAHWQGYRRVLGEITQRIKERVELGAGRVSDLREARLMELELEVGESQADRQLELIEREMEARFRLTPELVMPFFERYLSLRVDEVPVVESESIRLVKRIDLDLENIGYEKRQLKGELQPDLSLQLDTTFFDVDDFSNEYEMTGRLQMSFPIFDGGSNKARQNEADWRHRGLLSERASLIRNHTSTTQRALSDYRQATETLNDIDAQLVEMRQRFEALQAREGQTQSDPLSIARLVIEIAQAEAGRINNELNRELSVLQGIFFADQLGDLLALHEGEPTC